MDQLGTLLERHRGFWHRTATDRPLMRVRPWVGWRPYAAFVRRDGTDLPDGSEIRPGVLDLVATAERYRPGELVDADFVGGWGPFDCCWTEALLGCRIVRSGASVWTEPFIEDWGQVDALSPDTSEAWLGEFLAANRALVAEAKGAYPICQPLMRGPLDMIEAAVPTDLLYAGFYDHPEQVRKLLRHCTDLFITAAQRRLAETPAFHGGYMGRYEWGLWAPGPTVQFQADAMRNLSPEMYRDFMFEVDQRIAGAFEYAIIHTHSGSGHIIPVLAEEPELQAIEVTLDPAPYAPPPLELLPQFKLVQERGKSLLISGPMTRSELETLRESLSPVGLGIRAGLLDE